MLRILFIHNCFVCGIKTTHESSVCDECRNNCILINEAVCPVCGIPIISEASKCLRCRNREYAFERHVSLFQYSNKAKDVFYQYKFKKHRKIGLWYCSLLADVIRRDFAGFIVIPSPYRYFKKIRKGWDQVEYLSTVLNQRFNIPVENLLRRSSGLDQKKLDLENRAKNLKGNITVRKKGIDCKNKKFLFLDDIFTTGATADECSHVLIKSGASQVAVLTIAID